MKPLALDKKTCRQLRGAVTRRASITLTWPEDAPEPVVHRKYPVQELAEDNRLIVEAITETATGWEVTGRLNSDPVRGLRVTARKPVENPAHGGPQFRSEAEPEQVPSRFQRLLDAEGQIKTAMQGNLHRQAQERYRRESRAAKQYGKGDTSGARAAKRRAERFPDAA